jgi:hypothetical protein
MNYKKVASQLAKANPNRTAALKALDDLNLPPTDATGVKGQLMLLNDPTDFGGKSSNSNSSNNSPSSPFEQLYKSNQGTSLIANLPEDENVKGGFAGLFEINNLHSEIVKQIQRESNLQTQLNEKVGLTGELSNAFQKDILKTIPSAVSLGYSFANVTEMLTRMGEQSGRFNLISEETLQNSYAVGRAFVGDLANLAQTFTEFEKIGKGAYDTLAAISKAGSASLSLGLNSKKTTELLRENIGKLNEYGFKNGVDGLNRMVQRSIEFRMNLGEAFKVADNVMDPEKAIALTANLQVLGGAIGDFNDPLKLMYMATNNVEGLQKALIDAAKGLATYNAEQGRFEIIGVNTRRAHEMAAQLGVDYNELTKGAIAGQERMLANSVLMAKGFNVSKEDKEFITNMSQMKGGQMVVTIPEDVAGKIGSKTEIALKDLTASQIEALKGVKEQLKEKTPEQIARGQFTSIHNIEMMLQGIYRTVVTDVKNLTYGEKGIVDIKAIADRLQPNVKQAFLTANQQLPEFQKYVGGLFDTVKGGLTQLTGPFATQFENVTNEAINKFISVSAKANPGQFEEQYMKLMDQFSTWFQQSRNNKFIKGASIQNKLTIVDQSKGSKGYLLNQTKNAYIDDGID